MDHSTLILFAFAALAMTASPGPDMLLIASRSVAQGRLAGLATWAGIAAGTYCHALAAAFGLSQLFLAVPVAYEVVRYVGAAYLLYLAWRAFTSRDTGPIRADTPTKIRSARVMFTQGLLTNLLNPKMVVFVLALFPQFVDPAAGSVAMQVMIMATILNLIGFFVNGAVILVASQARTVMSHSVRLRQVSRIVLGTVFAGLAARLAFDTQR